MVPLIHPVPHTCLKGHDHIFKINELICSKSNFQSLPFPFPAHSIHATPP